MKLENFNISEILKTLFQSNFISTGICLLFFIALYSGFSFIIRKQSWSKDKQIRISVNVRNALFFLFIVTMIFLWGGGIKTLVLSAAAVCAAFFVAFKEIFLSFAGTISSNRSFAVGDFIDYDGHRGKIVDRNFITTTVALIDGGIQSRELIFTNMHYITNKIVNLSRLGKYQSHMISIGVEHIEDLYDHSQKVVEITKKVLKPYEEEYVNYFAQKSSENIYYDKPSLEPVLSYDLLDPKRPVLKVQFIVHPLAQKKLEAEIIKDYIIYCKEQNILKKEQNGESSEKKT